MNLQIVRRNGRPVPAPFTVPCGYSDCPFEAEAEREGIALLQWANHRLAHVTTNDSIAADLQASLAARSGAR